MKQLIITFYMLLLTGTCFSSDSAYIRQLTDTLASKQFSGRGYVNNGMQKAADFILAELNRLKVNANMQWFQYAANSFPGEIKLELDSKMLVPGKDYLVAANSKAVNARGSLQRSDSVTFMNAKKGVIIQLVDKLTWTVGRKQDDVCVFYVRKDLGVKPSKFKCRVDAQYIDNFKACNIIGSIAGTTRKDSLIVITAHYDHLGMMGQNTMFPGANDNAGGVALMLSLAKYYQLHPSPYTIVVIAFAGEEAGLLGSEYFVNHPTFKLNNIRFLLNLDLMGNGDEGITVVNATAFPEAFRLLQHTNDEYHLLAAINERGKARNSDHYWFTEKGVPSFFIYTLGKRKAYHDVDDIASTVPWFEANDLQTLLTEFISRLSVE